jgi:glyoxylase-like metal-dependent hydrolase (beta-lactamase superfamily II)
LSDATTSRSLRIGAIDVIPIFDGTSREPLATVVTRDDEAEWDCPAQPLDAEGRIAVDIGVFLVRTGDRTILVDAGIGTINNDRYEGGALPENLRRAGADFSDVTDVIFSHLHFDHVGWATQQGVVMFPNATYRAHAADWEHFVSGPAADPRAVKKLSPIAPQLETFASDCALAPGLTARHAPGHTPGSTIFVVEDGGERAWLLGDLAHTVAELTDPAWQGVYDLDRRQASQVRDQIAAEVAEAGDAFASPHFPGLPFGRLVVRDGRRFYEYL